MAETIYLNGEYLPVPEARISVYDGGFLHGAGLFETMRADYGTIFRLDAHIDRMLNSAEKLTLPIERPDLPLSKDFHELLQRNALQTARVRMTVTVGSMLASSLSEGRPELTVCVTAADLSPYPVELFARGMSVMIATFTQSNLNPMAGHKTTAYLPRLLALRNARKFNCGEALWFTQQNYLAEGCISNVFVVKGGVLMTPPLNTPVLPGVSRSVILELAQTHDIPTEEKPLNINDVLDADEVFLTNSSMQAMPVCRVEKKEIGDGKPGAITAKLRSWFQELVETECQIPSRDR